MGITNISRRIAVAIGLGFFALMPARALAHCDGLDGRKGRAACARHPQSGARADLSSGEGRTNFGEVMATRTFEPDDVAAGRAYVKAYVEFIHFVEFVYGGTMNVPHGHFEERVVPAK